MKVYIGKYPTNYWHCQIHMKYMDKKYGHNWENSNTRFEKFLEKCENSIQWIYDHSVNYFVKDFKRKIDVRIDTEDTWSMDNTLAHIILPMLKQLKDTKHGSPYVDKEDLPVELRLTKREQKVFDEGHWNKKLKATEEEIQAVSKKFHSQWAYIMDQMIWSFEQEVNEDDEHKHYYDPYEPNEIITPKTYNITDKDGNVIEKEWPLWSEKFQREMGKFNVEKHKVYNDRKQLGFTLFGKYYQALWD